MSSTIQNNELQPERQRTQQSMNNYVQRENEIRNKGHINQIKSIECMRILSINARGLDPSNNEKIERFIASIEQYQIDLMLVNEVNVKWIPANVDKMENRMKRLGRETAMHVADSKSWQTSKKNHLPGGVLNIVRRKFKSMTQEESIAKGKCGNWIAATLQHNGKTIIVINIHRLPVASTQGPRCCATQCNVLEGSAKSTTDYRKETLQQIKDYLNQLSDIDDVIIAGDMNQNVSSNEIRKFYSEIGVDEVHSRINQTPIENLDKTCVNGSNAIDSVAVSEGLMEFVEGSLLVSNNEIINTDHRAYIVDANLEDYFNEEFSRWDEIKHVMLDPAKRSHREKFVEELENQLDYHQIERMLAAHPNPTNQQIENIDRIITVILNKATTKVEGQRRGVPCSKKKAKVIGTIKHWKNVAKKAKGTPIDEEENNKIKSIYNINHEEGLSLTEKTEQLRKAKEEWEEMKVKGMEHRENDLLDLHPNELTPEFLDNDQKKKAALRSIIKNRQRKSAFKCMTKHIGRGRKRGLIKVHEVNENNQIVKTHIGEEEIEKTIMNHNRKHYSKAKNTPVCQDKTCNQLQSDNVRDKILQGRLVESDCDNPEVFEFLSLLKNPSQCSKPSFQPITADDWEREVRRSKKQSVSSVFSRRTCSVYKCALQCVRMTAIFVCFYNALLKQCYYPKRWQAQVETTLEKGKGPIIGKLRTVTLIEGDLQINMRMQMATGEEELIESDNRFSTANYGSRKNYSIETAILQKRLIFDHSLLETKPTAHNFTDLQSCYDRQLANVGSIVEESVGRNRSAMKLFTKLMPNFNRHVSAGYGISKEYCEGEEEKLEGTGQGNKFSGDMCRDVSCLIMRQIEKQLIGIFFVDKITGEEVQIVAVAFVDDADLMTEGSEAFKLMQEILNMHNRLHGATGGHVQEDKTTYYAWQWKWRQGQKRIQNVNDKLLINEKSVKQTSVNESVKSLGLFVNPTLKWIHQFEMMKDKMCEAMSKLRSTPLTIGNAYVFFNMCLVTQVFFGCGIISLISNQEKILMKISEGTLLRKLGLSEKFPRKVLCARKTQLGVGILKPNTILTILSLKLHLGHRRHQDATSKQIINNEKEAQFQHGFKNGILEIEEDYKPQNKTWSDEVAQRLLDRGIKIKNLKDERYAKTVNKTIIDYAVEHVKEKGIDRQTIAPINHVRICKRMILPCKLIGLTGRKETKGFKQDLEISCLMWKIPFQKVPKPSVKSIECWREFCQWLSNKEIITMCDFAQVCASKVQVSYDERIIKEIGNDQVTYY